MSGEIQVSYASQRTCYALVRNKSGQIWNTSTLAFEAYLTANYANYVISLTEQGSASGYYVGNFPTGIAAGAYNLLGKQQLGGSPTETDPSIGTEDFQWDGTSPFALIGLASSGQISTLAPLRIGRGTAVPNFPFKLVSSLDHVTPFTSGVVSGQILRDPASGGTWAALQSGGAVAEVGYGWYSVPLTSGDTLCNTAALQFTAVGISGGSADTRGFGLVLQRTSGQ